MNFSIQALHSDSEFSWQRAMNLALASKMAYLEIDAIRAETTRWGFERAEFFRQNRTEGFIAWDSQCVLLSFRGTKELGDWLTDLNAIRAEVSWGKVHKGFLDAFNDARQVLSGLLHEAAAADKLVWITGHSLGGALATIMLGELLESQKIHGIYTFGQPRAVNREAQAKLKNPCANRYFRFVNDDDVVTKLPALLQHVGEILWFDPQGNLKEAPRGVPRGDFGPDVFSDEEFEEFQEQVRSLRPQINREHTEVEEAPIEESLEPTRAGTEITRGLFPSVRDHFMDNYLKKIWAKLQLQG